MFIRWITLGSLLFWITRVRGFYFFFSEQNEPIGPLSPTHIVDHSTPYQPSSQMSHSARSPVVGSWPPKRSKSQGKDTALICAGPTAPHLRISLPILPQPPASWLWLCRRAQSVHNFKTQGRFTAHCWPRRHRPVYADGLGWRQEQGDGLRSFHAFFSFSCFFVKNLHFTPEEFRSKYIIFPKFLEKKVKKNKNSLYAKTYRLFW